METKTESPQRHLISLPGSSFGVWPWACVRSAGFPAARVLALGAPEAGALIEQALAAEGDKPLSRFEPERREALAAAFASATNRISAELRAAAIDPRLREAVTWQNRNAVHTALDVLARKPVEGGNKKVRQKERLMAAYIQRYCVKNDTIGFFGPVCWARLTKGPEALRVRPGDGLLARRAVYFEHWCIDAITSKLTEDMALRAFAPPRLMPYIRVEDGKVHVPFVGPIEMAPGQIAILTSCDGATPARTIADRVAARADLAMSDGAALAFLEQARMMGMIGWDFSVPMQLHPERELREMLGRIPDPALREQALSPLDQIEAARDRVAAAAGDAPALDRAMEELEETFRRITGVAPTRSAGKVYAARTLVYEDAHRDAEVEIGQPFLEKLGPPLSLLLASGRWVTQQVARRFQATLDALYARLAPSDGAAVNLIDFHKAFLENEPAIANRGLSLSPTVAAVQRELQARWAEILPLPSSGDRIVRLSSAELRPRVLAAFAADGPGWEVARYVSPDVMILASSLEAVQRGDFQLVLGEVHLANSLVTSLFIAQHPAIHEMQQIIDQDLSLPQVVPALPKRDWSQRTSYALLASSDRRYLFSPDPPPAPPERTLRVADLVVVRRDGKLEVLLRDGGSCGSAIEFMGLLLTMLTFNALQIVPDREHTPRIVIDDLVIARESWRFRAEALLFAKLADPLERWVELKRWQRAHGLPRFVYLKAPVETKPCFVDLDSPVYVDTLAKLARQTAELGADQTLRLSEMLPSFEHVFFPDQAGRKYTSELRIVMVDDHLAASGSSSSI